MKTALIKLKVVLVVALVLVLNTLQLPVLAFAAPVLVGDLDPGNSPYSNYSTFVGYNNKLAISLNKQGKGFELWMSDGTEAGTYLVKDINPDGDSTPDQLFEHNNELFFTADDGTHGFELWKSDGTETGTVMVKDINTNGESFPSAFVSVNNTLYFTADDGTHGFELWKSDGTEAGTLMVKDIYAGSASSEIADYGVYNNKLYFAATSELFGSEVWSTDGTESGTTMLLDINPGSDSSTAGTYKNFNGSLYFSANDGTNSHQIWKTNGTAATTSRVTSPGQIDGPDLLFVVDNALIFKNNNNLWKTDGNIGGEALLSEDVIYDNVDFLGNEVYYVSRDCLSSSPSVRFKKITITGTVTELSQLSTSDCSGESDIIQLGQLPKLNNQLLFQRENSTYGNEIWTTDGSDDGEPITDSISPGSTSSYLGQATLVNDTLFLLGENTQYGIEVWRIGDALESNSLLAPVTSAVSPIKKPVVSWTAVVGADTYKIFRNGTQIASTSLLTYTDNTVSDGEYEYSIKSSNANTDSNYSNIVTVVSDSTRPSIAFTNPVPFEAVYEHGPMISVQATDNLSGLKNMVIHVYTSANQLLTVCGSANSSQLAAGSMSCNLSTLSPGQYYIKSGTFDKANNNKTIISPIFTITN